MGRLGPPPLTQKGCYRAMSTQMSEITRPEVLARQRDRYARAGQVPKAKIRDERVELFGYHRKAATRPGRRLRAEIPIRTEWAENAPGFLEMATVAWCGGTLDDRDRHGWRFDAVDVPTTGSVLRGLPNRSETSVCGSRDDLAARLPFPLRGAGQRPRRRVRQPPVVALLRRADAARGLHPLPSLSQERPGPHRAEERHKRAAGVRLRALRSPRGVAPDQRPVPGHAGPVAQLLPAHDEAGEEGARGPPNGAPLARVLACAEVKPATKARLRAEKAALNPFAVRRQVDRQLKEIEAVRRASKP